MATALAGFPLVFFCPSHRCPFGLRSPYERPSPAFFLRFDFVPNIWPRKLKRHGRLRAWIARLFIARNRRIDPYISFSNSLDNPLNNSHPNLRFDAANVNPSLTVKNVNLHISPRQGIYTRMSLTSSVFLTSIASDNVRYVQNGEFPRFLKGLPSPRFCELADDELIAPLCLH